MLKLYLLDVILQVEFRSGEQQQQQQQQSGSTNLLANLQERIMETEHGTVLLGSGQAVPSSANTGNQYQPYIVINTSHTLTS